MADHIRRDAAPGALEGIRVLDLGRYIAAPYAARLLGDLGADVVKVESPDGDPFRRWEGGDRPYSPQFAAYNRNKRGVVLDLHAAPDLRTMRSLAAETDVLIENFRPGVASALGVGYEDLAEANPTLIYCSISGFGATGEYAQRPSFDTIVSAVGGLYTQMLDDDDPAPVGPAMSDLIAAIFAAHGVLAALLHRERTGQGQLVATSMLQSLLGGLLTEPASTFLDSGELTLRNTRQRRAQAYGVVAEDGLPLVVHLSVPDKFWNALLQAIGRLDLAGDPLFSTREQRIEHYDALEAILRTEFLRRTRAAWLEILDALDVPSAPINSMADLFADAALTSLGLEEEVLAEGFRPIRMTSSAIRMTATPARAHRGPPMLGQHQEEVLDEWGIDAR